MRLLILGAGGVGAAAALIAARRPYLSHVVLADYDRTRAERAAAATRDERFVADRPFLVVLHDIATGAPLFVGTVIDPTLTSS